MSVSGLMQAAVTLAPDQLELRLLPVPQPGPGEALVRVRSVGICGTDLQVHRGQLSVLLPLVLGHEYAGEVAALGPAVSGLQVGSPVAGMAGWGCGDCGDCRSGRANLCPSRRILGRTVPGAFAEFVRVPADTLIPLPLNISFLAGQAVVTLATAYHALARLGDVRGSTIALVGPGQAGLILLQVLREAGARSVTVVGTRCERLQLAQALGADETLQTGTPMPSGRFDVVVEAAGTASALLMAMDLARAGGTIVVYGISKTPVDGFLAAQLYHKELTLIGSRGTGDSYGPAMKALEQKRILVEPMVTHRFPLTAVSQAMAAAMHRESGALRVVIEP